MSSAESAMYRIKGKTPEPVRAKCRIERKPPPPVHAECRIKRKPSPPVHAECRTQVRCIEAQDRPLDTIADAITRDRPLDTAPAAPLGANGWLQIGRAAGRGRGGQSG